MPFDYWIKNELPKFFNKESDMKNHEMKYKGAIIEPSIYFGFDWYHPDHVDADWTGDGYTTYGCGHCGSIEDCKNEIGEMLEEHETT